jgi:hypothetical protein
MHLRDPRRAPVPAERDHSLDIGAAGGEPSLLSLDGFTVPSSSAGDVGVWVLFGVLALAGYRALRVLIRRVTR